MRARRNRRRGAAGALGLGAAILVPVLLRAAQGSTVAFTTIAAGDRSEIEVPREVVVRSADAWRRLWQEHGGAGDPPTVDFSTSMVLGVFLGVRPTAGYGVAITTVREDEAGLLVQYAERRPPADQVTVQVLTAPFHLVRVARRDGPVSFRRLPAAPER